jgi:hypothetical protein
MYEKIVNITGQASIVAPNLLDRFSRCILGINVIDHCLFILSVKAVHLAQATNVEIDEHFLTVRVIRKLTFIVSACLDQR